MTVFHVKKGGSLIEYLTALGHTRTKIKQLISHRAIKVNGKAAKDLAQLLHKGDKVSVSKDRKGPEPVLSLGMKIVYEDDAVIVLEKPAGLLDILIQAADALSAARPGARWEMLETYVKRLEDLERIALSFPGVGKTYAIQAGREIRVIVENDEISDADSVMLSRDIARKIENELSYPGQIKVTVIRETRAIEYAK